MSDSEAYLRELRRALPIWCRRRLLAEVREHFALAVAAEAERGVLTVDAEQMTIARLGPAQAFADQLLDDLRSGALGRVRRLAVTLTPTRLAAFATVAASAVVLGVVLDAPHSSSQPRAVQRPAVSHGAAAQAPVPAQATAKRAIEARARVRALDLACRVAWTAPSSHANRFPILVTVAKPGEISVAPGVWRTPGVSPAPIGRSKAGPGMLTTLPACLVTVAKPGEIQVASGVWRSARVSH